MAHLPRPGRRAPAAITLALALGVALAPALALAAARRLNPPLALGGQVAALAREDAASGRSLRPGYQVSPDGAAVVYLADQSTAGVVELYSVPVGGGRPVRLNGPLAPGGSVVEFAVDATGRRVVYRADQREDESFELFSVPIGGGAPVALNSFLVPGGDVTGFAISPDGAAVVFRADRNDDEVFDLFRAPIAGGPDMQLSERAGPQGDVQPDFAISPDGGRVLFRADPLAPGLFDLFSAPLAGGAPPAELGIGLVGQPGGASVVDFAISPDGARVALRARDQATGAANLQLAPADGQGGQFLPLTALGPGSSVDAPPPSEHPGEDWLPPQELPYAFTPDSAEVVFIADAIDGVYQLHAVPAGPGLGAPPAPTLLSPTVTGPRDVTGFRIGPGDGRILFRADIVDDRFELISVLRDGSSTIFLFPAAAPFADVREFAITPDGERAVYSGDFAADGQVELRSGPLAGSDGIVTLSGPLPPGGGVRAFALAGADRVVYSADQAVAGVAELYSASVGGGESAPLNPPPAVGGGVADFVVGPGPAPQVVFRGDLATDEVYNLSSVPAAGGAATTLSDTASVSGDVVAFALAPDGAHAIYLADQRVDERYELYAAPLAGGEAARLSGELAPGGDVRAFAVAPAGGRVVYSADQDTDEQVELYSAPIGGGPAVRISAPLPPAGDVAEFTLAADGARALYLADGAADGVFDLYSAPAAGGAPAAQLSALAKGRAILGFAASPDGGRVVFLADQGAQGVFELLSVPAGGGAPVTLGGPMPEGGAVRAFAFTPDGGRVVYAADQRAPGVVELFSVPSGGGPATRLSPTLAAGRDVYVGPACQGQRPQWEQPDPGGAAPFLISPDSRRVVYCADQDADEVLELFSVPVAGGAPPVKLNIPPGTGGGVRRFELTPDGARAVFTAVTLVAGAPQEQLYSAPIGGGARPPALLNGPVRPLSFVQRFAVSPDSAAVAFTSDREAAGQVGLYAAPVAGGQPSRRSGALAPGARVGAFLIGADGARVVYLADPRADGADELYATLMVGSVVPTRISDPLPPGGDVRPDFRLTAAGDAVYRADIAADELVELFQVPTRGIGVVFLPFVTR